MTFLTILLDLHVSKFEMVMCMIMDTLLISLAFRAYKHMKDTQIEDVQGGVHQ